MNDNLTIAILLSEKDKHLFTPWLRNHSDITTNKIVVGLDWSDGHENAYDALELMHDTSLDVFACRLNNDFAAARNKILEHCNTEWTLFLDADELLHPITKQLLQEPEHFKYWTTSQGDNDCFGIYRLNIFNRHIIDVNNYHECLIKRGVRYINCSPHDGASPGCHERPARQYSRSHLPLTHFQILHLKEEWTGNFRAKGYEDQNQQAAINDLNKKIEKTK